MKCKSLFLFFSLFFTVTMFAQQTTTVYVLFNNNRAVVDFSPKSDIWIDLEGFQIDSIIGYSSVDGSSIHNLELSKRRAKHVAWELEIDGVVLVEGRGGTDMFGPMYESNRCVAIHCSTPTYSTLHNDIMIYPYYGIFNSRGEDVSEPKKITKESIFRKFFDQCSKTFTFDEITSNHKIEIDSNPTNVSFEGPAEYIIHELLQIKAIELSSCRLEIINDTALLMR